MSTIETNSPTVGKFRAAAIALALVLGSLSVWVLAAEAVRPPIIGFTTDLQSAASGYQRRGAALAAAQIGVVRGDLWSEAAFASGNILWSRDKNAPNTDGAARDPTQALTEVAIAYAPHDSALWLLLAATYFPFDWSNERAAASLKMSYYTGSNTIALIPKRLLLSLQNRALDDQEFQELVRHDIQIAVSRKSEFMPALIAAYNGAPVSGRRFMEKSLAELDPGMLASIRSQAERR